MNSHLTFFLHKHDTQIHPRHRLIFTRVNSMNCLIKVRSLALTIIPSLISFLSTWLYMATYITFTNNTYQHGCSGDEGKA